jgi:hypothetical protein
MVIIALLLLVGKVKMAAGCRKRSCRGADPIVRVDHFLEVPPPPGGVERGVRVWLLDDVTLAASYKGKHTMDTAFLRAILEHDGAVPEGYSVQGLTPELLELLGAADMGRREGSLDVLSGWIYRGPGVYYSADELQGMGGQMAHNLTIGIGEQGTDSVFRRAFSALILGEIISADNRQAFLGEAQVHAWLEQGLLYLKSEQDRRGWATNPTPPSRIARPQCAMPCCRLS